jgi:hypothetical protein
MSINTSSLTFPSTLVMLIPGYFVCYVMLLQEQGGSYTVFPALTTTTKQCMTLTTTTAATSSSSSSLLYKITLQPCVESSHSEHANQQWSISDGILSHGGSAVRKLCLGTESETTLVPCDNDARVERIVPLY